VKRDRHKRPPKVSIERAHPPFPDQPEAALATRRKRRKIKRQLRARILRRDQYRCLLCGKGRDDQVELTVDHITPVAAGGTNDPDNLQTLCKPCNSEKRATTERHPRRPRRGR